MNELIQVQMDYFFVPPVAEKEFRHLLNMWYEGCVLNDEYVFMFPNMMNEQEAAVTCLQNLFFDICAYHYASGTDRFVKEEFPVNTENWLNYQWNGFDEAYAENFFGSEENFHSDIIRYLNYFRMYYHVEDHYSPKVLIRHIPIERVW